MKQCSVCSTELKFKNTPVFGGKLGDGSPFCLDCQRKLLKADPGASTHMKRYTPQKVQELFEKLANQEIENQEKLKEIQQTMINLNFPGMAMLFGRKEINELPKILAKEEMLDHVIGGMYNKGYGLLVSTNRRLLFVDKGLLYGLKVEDFPLDKITSIQYETGLLHGKIKIHTSGNVVDIEQVDKANVRAFAEFVRNKLSQPKEQAPIVVQAAAPSEPSVLDQLEKLAKLKDSGILSEEEFAEQKKKMLEKL